MRLDDTEEEMRAGRMGAARRAAIEQQIQVGMTFDAEDFVKISQVHLMADTESLGESGVEYLETIAVLPEEERRVRVPTVTDPRGIDLCAYRKAEAGGAIRRARAPHNRRTAGLGHSHDRHLHQLSDDSAAGARRASGVR